VLIHVDHLTHTYAPQTPLSRTALRDISLEIPPGQRVGIIGATGSGKSTLVQLLAGLLKPSTGQVLLDGTPAHQSTRSARARRRRIGIAFQYPEEQIFERTVFREVAFGLRARTRGKRTGRNTDSTQAPSTTLSRDQLRDRVCWALEQVGLDPAAIAQRSPLTLSGGEMRRVALASVLSTQPQVLILDEPTAGLDPQGRETLLAGIQSWKAHAPGVTLLVISHDLSHLARLVDRVVVLARGQIVADGPARRVLSDPNLLDAAGLQVPPPVALLHELRNAGWALRTDCLTAQDAVTEIARAHRLREAP